MKTKKRFFLKAAGISLAKGAGISLALVMMFAMMFAMAFAACDTGTSSKKPVTEDDDTDTGTRPTTPDTGTESTTYYMDSPSGYYVLTITEAASGAVSYSLAVSGTTVSSGTVTKGDSVWTFSPYGGQVFELSVISNGTNLAFIGKTITVNGNPIQIPTLYVNGYIPDSGQQQQPGIQVKDETTLRNALDTKVGAAYKTGVYRITSVMTLEKDLVVHAGQHIVVGGIANDNGDTGQFSAGGPLFAITGTSNILNIGTWLKLESGASLSIAKGGAVNVTSGGTLYAKTGAAVGVGVNVSGRTVNIGTSGVSNLHIAGGGALHIEKTATLAVNNTTSISKVYLESTNSALTLEDGAELAIEVVTTPAVDADGEPDAEAEADRIIGSTGSSVIQIPATAPGTPGAPAAISTTVSVNATGYTGTIASEIGNKVIAAATAATADSTAQIKDDANATGAELQALLNGTATRVTYTGTTETLSGITIPDGKTLVISGEISEQATAIATRGTGKLEITGTVTTADEDITKEILQSLVGASGGGTVVLKGPSGDGPHSVDASGTPDLVVNLTLEIDSNATLALGTAGLTINSPGTIDNNGIISTTQANIPGADLGELLALVGGTVEVLGTGSIAVASGTLAIPADTTLKLSGNAELTVATGANLTVEDTANLNVAASATLTNNGTVNFIAGSTLETPVEGAIENNNTINTATTNQATLKALVAATVSATASVPGRVVLNGASATAKAEVTLTEPLTLDKQDLVIGEHATLDLDTFTISDYTKVTNGGTITTATTSGETLKNILTAGGKITASAAVTGLSGNTTVSTGTTLTISTSLALAPGAVLTFVEGATVAPTAITATGATIRVANKTQLEALLPTSAKVTGGTVETTAAVSLSEGASVTVPVGVTLNIGTHTLTTTGATLVNSGIIKTAVTTIALLNPILGLGGVIEIEDFTVDHATNPTTTLTVPASTILTVPNNRTLTLGGTNAGTLVLTDATSKLVLLAGGIVKAANVGSTIVGTGNVESAVKVSAVDTSSSDAATAVTNTGSSTNWVLTKGVATSAPVVTVILGKFKLVTPENAVLTDKAGETASSNPVPAPGTLKAGANTKITFAGASS